jgi:nanoRNase/pAp phosphatase (c-di-AMP/oligoRNAs hydrolase)
LLLHIQDRDLWRWELDHTKEVLAYLDSFEFDFQVWRDVYMEMVDSLDRVVDKGAQIVRYKEQTQKRLLENAQWITMQGHRIPSVNTAVHQSEVGNLLCQMHPEANFSASYYDREDGARLWSLRSIGEFDVSAVAKVYGGGGHRNAAGFRQTDRPSTWTEPSPGGGSTPS